MNEKDKEKNEEVQKVLIDLRNEINENFRDWRMEEEVAGVNEAINAALRELTREEKLFEKYGCLDELDEFENNMAFVDDYLQKFPDKYSEKDEVYKVCHSMYRALYNLKDCVYKLKYGIY